MESTDPMELQIDRVIATYDMLLNSTKKPSFSDHMQPRTLMQRLLAETHQLYCLVFFLVMEKYVHDPDARRKLLKGFADMTQLTVLDKLEGGREECLVSQKI